MFAGETVRFVRYEAPGDYKKTHPFGCVMSLCLCTACLARQLKHQARTAKVRILLVLGKCRSDWYGDNCEICM